MADIFARGNMPGTDPSFAVLRKSTSAAIAANLANYEDERQRFSWEATRAALHSSGPFNIARIALDRHVEAGRGDRIAARFVDRVGGRHDVSYSELQQQADRFASVLDRLDPVGDGRVFSLLGRSPELHVTALGTLRSGRVFCPLFTAFGPEPIQTRLSIGSARVLVTTPALYARKVAPLRDALPALRHVVVVCAPGEPPPPGTVGWADAPSGSGAPRAPCSTTPDSPALLHFTSGTTGPPKGVVLPQDAVVAQYSTARHALDLRDSDRVWCTADPGWVTGLAYGVIAPLVCGVTSIVDTEEFDARRWYTILSEERVSVWYTAPTAIRMLMKAGIDLAREKAFPALRFLASVGEPLNPEAVVWGVEAFGLPFHDNWWQTETGAIMIANYAAIDVKPGSMGRPVPGVDAAILRRTDDGRVAAIESPDEVGELALRTGWPSMFREYLGQPGKYRACFTDGWYLTGDLARRDADGYFWFVGRKDDVIKSAGHLISPFEVESALLAHPAVAQAGVIGLPDPVAHEVVKAFVELKPGFDAGETLRKELMAHARRRLGAAVAPREIAFLASIPRTRSGKIMRRVLKARELGQPEGDLSTLEGPA